MPREDKRQQIMRAALELLRHRHIHQVTLDEVAQRARVGKGTLYLYFQDKDDLFFQTALAGFDDLRALLEKRVSAEAPFDLRLRDACIQIDSFFAQRRSLIRMIQIEEGRVSEQPSKLRLLWLEKRSLLVGAVAEILRAGIEEGQLRKDLSPELLSEYLLSTLRTRARDLDELPEKLRTIDVFLSLFLDGARTANRSSSRQSRRPTR
jgi:AcrR family transcriptional regulator